MSTTVEPAPGLSADVATRGHADVVAPPSNCTPRERFYHPELDGLRFFAFLGVFVYHAFPITIEGLAETTIVSPSFWIASLIMAGEWGVDLFFVLSAYLITELLLREHERNGSIDIKAFYVRRTLRIWPLYFAFLLFAFFFEPRILGVEQMEMQHLLPFSLFLGNWSLVHSYTMFSAAIILWTVSIEEQFYLTWPLLVRWFQPRRILALGVIMLVVANLTRVGLMLGNASFEQVHFNTFARLDGLAFGVLIAALFHGRGVPNLSWWRRGLLVCGGLAIWVSAGPLIELSLPRQLGVCLRYPIVALGAAGILIGILRPQGRALGITTWKPVVSLGRISYGLYVVHYLAISLVDVFLLQHLGSSSRVVAFLCALPLTIYLATCTYFLIEKPFLKLKSRFTHIVSRPDGWAVADARNQPESVPEAN